MLILLPPSEGKSEGPATGPALDLAALSFPELTLARSRVISALVKLANGPRRKAVDALGLTPGLADEVGNDAVLLTASTMPAADLYTGVLYEALDLNGLPITARHRADEQVIIFSALFGAVRPQDRIPRYRLSPSARLPRLGTLASVWKPAMTHVLDETAGADVVLDLRSGPYAALWKPGREVARRTVSVRVLHEVAPGKRKVVSHFNKATKGRIVADLLRRRGTPKTPEELAHALASAGWTIESDQSGLKLDVIVQNVY